MSPVRGILPSAGAVDRVLAEQAAADADKALVRFRQKGNCVFGGCALQPLPVEMLVQDEDVCEAREDCLRVSREVTFLR